MEKCKNCTHYKTHDCPKIKWVGKILLDDEDMLRALTPCESYQYLSFMQRILKRYREYKKKSV